jgi:hypothetical protein
MTEMWDLRLKIEALYPTTTMMESLSIQYADLTFNDLLKQNIFRIIFFWRDFE